MKCLKCQDAGEVNDLTDSGSGWTVYCDCGAAQKLQRDDSLKLAARRLAKAQSTVVFHNGQPIK